MANEAEINFIQLDILDADQWTTLPACNIIVSNPPYIPLSDKELMQPNVVLHEPHIALFVNNDDPLLFYRKIAELGKSKLEEDGKIYVETHEELAASVADLFNKHGYSSLETKNDMQGKERMVRAIRKLAN